MILNEILSSKARAEIFRLLFTDLLPDLYLREIERLSNCTVTPLKKELDNLINLDLVKMRKDGNRNYYKANNEHPIFIDIKNLTDKTCGYIYLLKKKLKTEKIKVAFIFGSVAKGEEGALSDIDLFVIGDIGLRDVSAKTGGLQERIGREINSHVYKKEDFIKKLKKFNNFILNVVKEDKIFLVGNEIEFKKLIR
jgi:predicted nucleotidyltransferase